MRIAIIGLLLAFSACSSGAIVKDRPVAVSRPVVVPCAGERPDKPTTLRQDYPNWQDMDVRQKSAAVGKKYLERRTYGEQLDAATAACE